MIQSKKKQKDKTFGDEGWGAANVDVMHTRLNLLPLCFRTNTVVLIDSEGRVTFTERNMINADVNQWKTNTYEFNLHT